MVVLIVLLSIVSSLYFYVEAIKAGLHETRWALAGLFFGPAVLPMFTISRHIAWRRDAGFNNSYLPA